MAEILSGKETAEALNRELKEKCAELKDAGRVPCLAIVRVGENPSDLSYERGVLKRAAEVGVEVERITLQSVTETSGETSGEISVEELKDELIRTLKELNEREDVHGVLMFRPLPGDLRKYEHEICNTLLPEKDVDCMTDVSLAAVYLGQKVGFPPCTPEACIKILDHYGIDPKGMETTIIGRSLVVGKPLAMMLLARNATITTCHTRTKDVAACARRAELLISSAGVLKSLTKDYVNPDQIVIDVSINWDPDKKEGKGGIAGDADFENVEPLVRAITPVPGGVGAVTTSVLLNHVAEACMKMQPHSSISCRQYL